MFLNFLKGFVSPSYIEKYRSMNLFFAIAIFFIASFILAIPQMYTVSKERYNLVDVQGEFSLDAFNELSEDDLETLRSLGVKVYNGAINERGNAEELEFYIFNLDNRSIYLVFDFFDVTDPEAEPNLNIYEEFLDLGDENDILLAMYLDFAYYASKDVVKELKYNVEIDFTNIIDGKDLSPRLIDMFIPDINREISLYAFVAAVIYPLVIVILIWLLYKTFGSNLSFKEYYNIGAIASVVPLLVVFIFSWIFPYLTLIQYYTVIFGLYYLFMIIMMNRKTKIA